MVINGKLNLVLQGNQAELWSLVLNDFKTRFFIIYHNNDFQKNYPTALNFTIHLNVTLCDIPVMAVYHNGTDHTLSPQESTAGVYLQLSTCKVRAFG